ncbi:MAG: TonB-dependent receptor [Myxococcales bacterium]|nr:TonB-dependent receptor [Myxococcales bacterium]
MPARRRPRSALALLLTGACAGLGLVALPGAARADGLADEADLQFELASELIQKNDYRGALEHYLASNRLVPNRNVVYNIARTYGLLKRFPEAYRYYVDALDGETDPKTRAEIEAAMQAIAPEVAVLRVVSDPPGATIFLDREDLGSRGRAPRPLALPPGKYRVIVQLDGYQSPEPRDVDIQKGGETRVELSLKEIRGTVHVEVEGAAGATVHVGDERAASACNAPCDFTLRPGTYLLYFERDGFQAAPRQVVVTAGATANTLARLTPLSGSVVVESDERGAIVMIDGKPSGFTPAVIPGVTVGKHEVKVVQRGFAPLVRDIDVKANAQAELLGLRLEPLRQVQAVSRVTENIEDAPSSLSIVDGQELRAFGYPTIAHALAGVRGVYVSNDRAYQSVGIRGIGEPNDYGNRLLVLSDGASLNDNLLNSSYVGSDGRNDLGDVERIEIVRGPGSLLYGAGAFSGVVNLVPRARDELDGVHVAAGTYGHGVARGRGGFHWNFTEDGGVWASVSGARSEGFDLPIDRIDPGRGPIEQIAHGAERFDAVGTAGRLWYGPLTAQWFYHQRDQYLPQGLAATQFDDSRTLYGDRRALGEIRFEPKIGDIVDVSTRVHANHYRFHGVYYLPAPDSPLLEDYYGSWLGGEARVVIKPIPEIHITAGGEAQFHVAATLEGASVSRDEQPIPDGVYMDERQPYRFGAAYALFDTTPVDWFKLSVGARVDIYSTFGAIFVPRGALIFKPTEGGALKIMSGRAFRAPSIYEQLYNDGGFSQVKASDPDRDLQLKPESIVSNEIEYSQRFEEDWVAVGAVHTSYIQSIINTISDTPGSEVIRYANSDSPALTVGLEAELRREWRQGWMLALFYGYERAQYLDPSDPTLADNPRLINAPEHSAGAKGVVPIVNEALVLGVRTRVEAPRRIALDSDEVTLPAVIADVTLSGTATRYGIRYVLGIYNAFDWKHEVPISESAASRTIRQDGRTFLLDVSATYP